MSRSGHSSDEHEVQLNRRDVLKLSSFLALAGTGVELQGCKPSGHQLAEETDRLRIARADDMALVEIGLVGMTRSDDDTTLSWTDNQVARLVLYFQPQHILEGAYWNLNNPSQPTNPDDPVPTRISGESADRVPARHAQRLDPAHPRVHPRPPPPLGPPSSTRERSPRPMSQSPPPASPRCPPPARSARP